MTKARRRRSLELNKIVHGSPSSAWSALLDPRVFLASPLMGSRLRAPLVTELQSGGRITATISGLPLPMRLRWRVHVIKLLHDQLVLQASEGGAEKPRWFLQVQLSATGPNTLVSQVCVFPDHPSSLTRHMARRSIHARQRALASASTVSPIRIRTGR